MSLYWISVKPVTNQPYQAPITIETDMQGSFFLDLLDFAKIGTSLGA